MIALIRAAKNPKEAREALMAFITPAEAKEYAKLVDADPRGPRFTERQAQAIIELQLQRLTGMEQQKILDELADIQKRIAEYLEILGSEKVLRGVVVEELKEVQKDFGDERRTQIVEDTGEITLEDLVQVEDVAVTVTRGGYLKRTAVDTYRRQTRGGKGRIGMSTRAEDVVEHLIIASTHAYLLIFTNKGRVYWLKIYNIPDAGTTGKGKHASGLMNLQPDEMVTAFLPVKEFVAGKFIVMVTKQGVIKKCELTEFDNPMSRGIIALGLDEGDELLAARLTSGSDYIFLGSHEGMACRFNEDDVRPMGRPARGVRGMELEEGDYLVGAEVVGKEGLDSLDLRERLRQAHAAGGLSPDGARPQGRDQHEDHAAHRQGGGHSLGEGRFRADDHHQAGPDHPHRFERDPAGRPLDAGRPAGERRGRRSGGRGQPDSGCSGRRHERAERSAVAVRRAAILKAWHAGSKQERYLVRRRCGLGQRHRRLFRRRGFGVSGVGGAPGVGRPSDRDHGGFRVASRIAQARCRGVRARAAAFRHEYIATREFDNPDYVKNDPDRCFHCKDELFTRLDEVARERGIAHVIYGVNVDDLGDYRPGSRRGEDFTR